MSTQQITIPTLVRIKPGAIDRVGIYLRRAAHLRAVLFQSDGLPSDYISRVENSLADEGVNLLDARAIQNASLEQAFDLFGRLPSQCQAVLGLGGGKALDVAKYVAFLAGLPYYAVPTSLSNDGFCSPQSSLTLQGRKRSLPARLPYGVVIDTEVCLLAPKDLWCSGVGDLVAKATAVLDWKLAFHQRGEPVNDFAALLSDATVFQFMARPTHDLEGVRLLGTALMLNGIAMEICGSSRPASGSEHLISHALDQLSGRPRLHGLQVGTATYLVSLLHGQQTDRIAQVLDQTGFWRQIEADPFQRELWRQAVALAPSIKEDYFTILHVRDWSDDIARLLATDARLKRCFV